MSVTIQDIAKQLNLAPSTVSKALNGYPHISEATRKRVLQTAEALEYVPSAAARSLRRQRTDKVGFSFGFPVPMMSDYVSGIIIGAVTAAEQQGYNLTLYPSMDDQLKQLTQLCRAREVDGVLLFGRPQMNQTTIPLLKKEGIPFVVVGRRVDDAEISYVKADDPAGARAMTRHLIAQGHRRIGFTSRPSIGLTGRDRLAGYRAGLEEGGLPFDESLVVATTFEEGSGAAAMNALLDLPEPPTAVFAIHDLVALECLQAARGRGRRVPDDVAIAGFDNWRLSLTTDPPLTTVDPPLTEIGERAMKLLLAHLADPSLPAEQVVLPVELVVRQSTSTGRFES